MTDSAPAQREGEPLAEVIVEWEGYKLTLPGSVDDWTAETLEAFESGRAIRAIRGLIGSKEYDKIAAEFKRERGRALTVRNLMPLADVIAETYGFDKAGE